MQKHIIRCGKKSRYLDLMRYSLLHSPWNWVFADIGCFQKCDKKLSELLLSPGMDIFSYGKAHTPFSHPHHCIVLGVFSVRGHCVLCTWRSDGPLAEVCVCLFLVNSAILLAWVCLVSLCVLVLLIPKNQTRCDCRGFLSLCSLKRNNPTNRAIALPYSEAKLISRNAFMKGLTRGMTRKMEHVSLPASAHDSSSACSEASDKAQLESMSNAAEDDAALLLHSWLPSPLHCWIHTRYPCFSSVKPFEAAVFSRLRGFLCFVVLGFFCGLKAFKY